HINRGDDQKSAHYPEHSYKAQIAVQYLFTQGWKHCHCSSSRYGVEAIIWTSIPTESFIKLRITDPNILSFIGGLSVFPKIAWRTLCVCAKFTRVSAISSPWSVTISAPSILASFKLERSFLCNEELIRSGASCFLWT